MGNVFFAEYVPSWVNCLIYPLKSLALFKRNGVYEIQVVDWQWFCTFPRTQVIYCTLLFQRPSIKHSVKKQVYGYELHKDHHFCILATYWQASVHRETLSWGYITYVSNCSIMKDDFQWHSTDFIVPCSTIFQGFWYSNHSPSSHMSQKYTIY